MVRSSPTALTLLRATAALMLATAGVAAAATSHAVVHIERQCRGDGEIVLAFTPESGEEHAIIVRAIRKSKTKVVSRQLMTELRYALDQSVYRVKMKDERKISVEGRKGAPRFDLSIEKQSVPGLSVFVRYRN